LQWLTTPVALTSDQVAYLQPSATVYGNEGEVIVSGTKMNLTNAANMAVSEDPDVYTQNFSVATSAFTATTAAGSLAVPAPYAPLTSVNGDLNTGVLAKTTPITPPTARTASASAIPTDWLDDSAADAPANAETVSSFSSPVALRVN
jgi:hypothetical protein